MREPDLMPIVDIKECVEQARQFSKPVGCNKPSHNRLQRAFISLAGDEVVGLIAYAIWRLRTGHHRRIGNCFLKSPVSIRYDVTTRSRRAQS